MAHKFDKIPKHILAELKSIIVQFEPENLNPDGKLTYLQIDKKITTLSKRWNLLAYQSGLGEIDFDEFEEYFN